MKWRAIIGSKAALMSCIVLIGAALTNEAASAAVLIISNDVGGEVSSYVQKFQQMRAAGERVVIDGPCLSACTLLTGIIPRDRVCVTSRAELGFHAASYYDDASRSFIPTRAGSEEVMRFYPATVRAWIGRHGGLTPKLKMMRGEELTALYRTCE
jgi:hypothetical protein